MTLSLRSSVGLAQAIFYIPAALSALYLCARKHHRPRMAWLALLLFSTVRIAGGIVLALFEQHADSVSFIIATIVLQGTGVVPLIISSVGLLRIVQSVDFPHSRVFEKSVVGLRVFFLAGIAVLVAGSCLIGNYKDPGDVSTGTKLAKAGYVLIAAVLVVIAGFDAVLLARRGALTQTISVKVSYTIAASIPFLVVRIAYACLSLFSTDQKWSPLFGSVAALVTMHSLMEYVVVVLYVVLGFRIPAVGSGKVNSRSVGTGDDNDVEALRQG